MSPLRIYFECSLRTSLVIFLMLVTISVSQPAELGVFNSHGDYQHAISTYSQPSEDRVTEGFVLAFINYSYVNSEGKEIVFSEEKAKYGEGRIKTVGGPVVHVTDVTDENNRNDHTACSDRLLGTNGRPLPHRPWVALIRRGNCNFEDKVKHAYEHRAVGVIVYNDRDQANLDKMKILDKERNITAVFTYKSIGEEMARIVDSGHELSATISEGRHAKPIPNINRTSVLFVSISFIVLMIISFVWLVFYYVQRFRYLQTKDRKSRQLCTVAKRVIAKIPTKSIKSEDNNDLENDCCAICIEPYKITDVIRVLPCRHEFHKSCIDPWLLEHRTCPMCKMDILKHYGFVVGAQNQIINIHSFVMPSPTFNHTPNLIISNPLPTQSLNSSSSTSSSSSPSPTQHLYVSSVTTTSSPTFSYSSNTTSTISPHTNTQNTSSLSSTVATTTSSSSTSYPSSSIVSRPDHCNENISIKNNIRGNNMNNIINNNNNSNNSIQNVQEINSTNHSNAISSSAMDPTTESRQITDV